MTISYITGTQYYLDFYQPTHGPCGPSWMPCDLWSQSYNARYISLLDNGRGWHESIGWELARNNTRGVSTGAINDPFACTGHETQGSKWHHLFRVLLRDLALLCWCQWQPCARAG